MLKRLWKALTERVRDALNSLSRPRRLQHRQCYRRLAIQQLEDRCLLAGEVLDTTFDLDGIRTLSVGDFGFATEVAIQSSNKIVVAGFSTNFDGTETVLVRFNPDGSLV